MSAEESATELGALIERIDELDEIDELVDWQLSRPELDDDDLVNDELVGNIEDVVVVRRDGASASTLFVYALSLDPEADPGPIVSILVISLRSALTRLSLTKAQALALASYLTTAAALAGPTERHVITIGGEQTGEGTA